MDFIFEGVINGSEHNKALSNLEIALSYAEAMKLNPQLSSYKITLASPQAYIQLLQWTRPPNDAA